MRQAYDYWQNQPGNYRARGNLREATAEGPPEGTRNRPKVGGRSLVPGPSQPPGPEPPGVNRSHPIAPTEFPKGRSARRSKPRPRRQASGCSMHPSRGGYQPPDHVRRRLPASVGPRLSDVKNDSQRPVIHRLRQRPQKPKSSAGPRWPVQAARAPSSEAEGLSNPHEPGVCPPDRSQRPP